MEENEKQKKLEEGYVFLDFTDVNDEGYEEEQEEINEIMEKHGRITMPCVPTRSSIVFPGMLINLDVGRQRSIYAVKDATKTDELVFLAAQKDVEVENPKTEDLYEIGTIAVMKQVVEPRAGLCRCLTLGLTRAKLINFNHDKISYTAEIQIIRAVNSETIRRFMLDAIIRKAQEIAAEYFELYTKLGNEFPDLNLDQRNPYLLFDSLISKVQIPREEMQRILEADTVTRRLSLLIMAIKNEIDISRTEISIEHKVQSSIDQNQRDFYLREKLRAIQEELGENPDAQGDPAEIEEYRKKLEGIKSISEDAVKKLNEEIEHLAKMPSYSQEAALVRNYLDTCLSLPWDEKTEDNTDVERASEILDEDHYGIRKVKDRVLETIAVRALTPEVKGQILCLYGPPGVGKTSVAKSIARALDRKYVRVSLGGVRDESEIRGHRKTYLGSMPGRIIAALKQAGSSNPVMLLDEIDKMGNDFRGDPSSAMLEVLDSEQNFAFRDHYTEIPFDLSDVLFITTANSLDTVAAPLLDRMEVIELSSYTREEKFHIAKEHLVPKQLKRYGIKASQLRINDSAIYSMVDYYTREAGVRKLEQCISAICRRAAKEIISGKTRVSVKGSNIEDYLGHKKYLDDYYLKKAQVGCVNGLAWTSVGGVVMPLETLVLDGKGKIELTGSLGDVMKESAKLAVSNARRLAKDYGISSDFYEKKDIHIHAPEGATPKDGPSAGVTMTTALISALSGAKVRSDVAMTGEITLTGNVLPIGGLKEKTMAAYKAGIKTVIIPEANKGDLDELDEVVRDALEFVPVKKIEDVLSTALVNDDKKSSSSGVNKRRRAAKDTPSEKPTEVI
ncbi:MAG: endopeptidase La [Ruminococcus sp.]|nr:endopeptidase La [Ruminococcus sp.]